MMITLRVYDDEESLECILVHCGQAVRVRDQPTPEQALNVAIQDWLQSGPEGVANEVQLLTSLVEAFPATDPKPSDVVPEEKTSEVTSNLLTEKGPTV